MAATNFDARIEQAIFRTAHVRAFLNRFPPIEPHRGELLPAISWDQILRQLRSLAGDDFERPSWELEVLKATARNSPPELFYRELLTLAWSLIDDTCPPSTTGDAMD